MVQHFCVRAAFMKHLEPLDELRSLAPETLRDRLGRLPSGFGRWKLGGYFLLAQGVVLELLGGLLAIHRGREHIVQAELPGEDVHHDANDAFVGLVACSCRCPFAREPIQNI